MDTADGDASSASAEPIVESEIVPCHLTAIQDVFTDHIVKPDTYDYVPKYMKAVKYKLKSDKSNEKSDHKSSVCTESEKHVTDDNSGRAGSINDNFENHAVLLKAEIECTPSDLTGENNTNLFPSTDGHFGTLPSSYTSDDSDVYITSYDAAKNCDDAFSLPATTYDADFIDVQAVVNIGEDGMCEDGFSVCGGYDKNDDAEKLAAVFRDLNVNNKNGNSKCRNDYPNCIGNIASIFSKNRDTGVATVYNRIDDSAKSDILAPAPATNMQETTAENDNIKKNEIDEEALYLHNSVFSIVPCVIPNTDAENIVSKTLVGQTKNEEFIDKCDVNKVCQIEEVDFAQEVVDRKKMLRRKKASEITKDYWKFIDTSDTSETVDQPIDIKDCFGDIVHEGVNKVRINIIGDSSPKPSETSDKVFDESSNLLEKTLDKSGTTPAGKAVEKPFRTKASRKYYSDDLMKNVKIPTKAEFKQYKPHPEIDHCELKFCIETNNVTWPEVNLSEAQTDDARSPKGQDSHLERDTPELCPVSFPIFETADQGAMRVWPQTSGENQDVVNSNKTDENVHFGYHSDVQKSSVNNRTDNVQIGDIQNEIIPTEMDTNTFNVENTTPDLNLVVIEQKFADTVLGPQNSQKFGDAILEPQNSTLSVENSMDLSVSGDEKISEKFQGSSQPPEGDEFKNAEMTTCKAKIGDDVQSTNLEKKSICDISGEMNVSVHSVELASAERTESVYNKNLDFKVLIEKMALTNRNEAGFTKEIKEPKFEDENTSRRRSFRLEAKKTDAKNKERSIKEKSSVKSQDDCVKINKRGRKSEKVSKKRDDEKKPSMERSSLDSRNDVLRKEAMESFDDKKGVEEILKSFDQIDENVYLVQRSINKETKRVICDCVLSQEEIEHGEFGCGEDCLNRLLLIECGSRCGLGDRCTNKRFQNRSYIKCQVFKTKHKGYGLRALEDVPRDTFVMEYVGEVVDWESFNSRILEYQKRNSPHHYFMMLQSEYVIDSTIKGNMSRFINHSCDPNSETQKWSVEGELRIGFFTIRDIKAGEEITFDYKLQRYGKHVQKCMCGAANCRGLIGAQAEEEVEDADQSESLEKWETVLDEITETGLIDRDQTLNLNRMMVYVDLMPARFQILKLLQEANHACKKLFIDYHGLPLLWSWMVDSNNTTDNEEFKMELLKTLKSLPITNKTTLIDSKIVSVVEQWANSTLPSAPVVDTACIVLPEGSNEPPQKDRNEENMSIAEYAKCLLNTWASLKDTYRIPKKLRIEQTKEHEMEAERTKFGKNHGLSAIQTVSRTSKYGSSRDRDEDGNGRGQNNRKRRRWWGVDNPRLFKRSTLAQDHDQSEMAYVSGYEESFASNDSADYTNYAQPYPDQSFTAVFPQDPNVPLFSTSTPYVGQVPPNFQHPSYPPPYPQPYVQQYGPYQYQYLSTQYAAPGQQYQYIQQEPYTLGYYPGTCEPLVYEDTGQHPELPHVPPEAVKLYDENKDLIHSLLAQNKIQSAVEYSGESLQDIPLPPPAAASADTQTKIQNESINLVLSQIMVPNTVEFTDLSPVWKSARDSKGRVYYYHIRTKQTQWFPPTFEQCCENNEDVIELEISDTESSSSDEETDVRGAANEETVDVTALQTIMDSEIRENLAAMSAEFQDSDSDIYSPAGVNSLSAIAFTYGDQADMDSEASSVNRNVEHKEKHRKRKKRRSKSGDSSTKHETAFADSSSIRPDLEQKVKENFRSAIASYVVFCLKPYFKPECTQGRITNESDFKHLARKLTYFVMVKEQQQCGNVMNMAFSSSVRRKTKNYIRKYMAKYGESYQRPATDGNY